MRVAINSSEGGSNDPLQQSLNGPLLVNKKDIQMARERDSKAENKNRRRDLT